MRNERKFYKDNLEKEALRIDRLVNEYRNNYYKSCEYIPIPPYKDGWIRRLVVREDLRRTAEAHLLQEVIKLVTREQFCRRKDFKRIDWKTRKLVDMEFQIRKLNEKEYDKLPEKLKNFFVRVIVFPKYGACYYAYEFVEKMWKFKFKIEPHYIKYRIVYDSNFQSLYERTKNIYYRKGYGRIVDKLYGHSKNNGWDRAYNKNRINRNERFYDIEMKEAIQEFGKNS